MYLNRILLLVLVVLYVFAPILSDWVAAGGTQWYRPHMIWFAIIVVAASALYRKLSDGV